MANNAKSPTKAQIESELKETKNTLVEYITQNTRNAKRTPRCNGANCTT